MSLNLWLILYVMTMNLLTNLKTNLPIFSSTGLLHKKLLVFTSREIVSLILQYRCKFQRSETRMLGVQTSIGYGDVIFGFLKAGWSILYEWSKLIIVFQRQGVKKYLLTGRDTALFHWLTLGLKQIEVDRHENNQPRSAEYCIWSAPSAVNKQEVKCIFLYKYT